MVLFWATINSDSIYLFMFPFISQVQLFSVEISFVCCAKFTYIYISSFVFVFLVIVILLILLLLVLFLAAVISFQVFI